MLHQHTMESIKKYLEARREDILDVSFVYPGWLVSRLTDCVRWKTEYTSLSEDHGALAEWYLEHLFQNWLRGKSKEPGKPRDTERQPGDAMDNILATE